MMELKIAGITCGACKKLIDMDLKDAGYGKCAVDEKSHTIIIPQEYVNDLTKIAAAIENAGNYTLITD